MLTPVDLKNHTFKPSMGRYDKNEVDIFMDSVQADYESLYKKNSELNATIAQLTSEVNDYRKQQSTLANAMLLADETRTRIEKDANEAAEKVKSEAQAEADKVRSDAHAEADKLLADAKAEADEKLSKANSEAANIQSRTDSLMGDAQAKADSLTSEAQQQHDSLINDAKAEADRLISEAKTEADKTLSEAKAKTDNMLADKNTELKGINDQIEELRKCHDEYKKQFEAALQKQLDAVKSGSLDVSVPGLVEKTKAAADTYKANEAQLAKSGHDNTSGAAASGSNERIKAFDASDEDLDENGLNASGLNFDIDKGSNGGIVIDDFETVPPSPEASEESASNENVPASDTAETSANTQNIPSAAAKSADSDYADFQNVPSFNNMDEFVAHSSDRVQHTSESQQQNAPADTTQSQNVDTSSYGYVKTANGYEMPADMGEDEFGESSDTQDNTDTSGNNPSENNGGDDGGPFKFINA